MRAPTDLPRRGRGSTSKRIVLVLVAVAIFTVVISLRGIAGFYTDYLWFDEVGFTSVWRGILGAKIGLAVVFTLVFFAILWANLAIADLLAPTFRPMGPEEQFVERYHEIVGSRAGVVRVAVAAVFALIAGPGVAGQWQSWLLFRNQVPFLSRDPEFHRDIGFYVFELPFAKFVVDWLFASLIIVLIVTAIAHYLNGGIRFQTPLQKVTPQVKAHLSVLLAVLALLKAAGYFLQRFELVFSTRGTVDGGAGYTDVNAQLPALNLLVLISLFACALFLVNILRRGWVLPVIAVGVWALISVVDRRRLPRGRPEVQGPAHRVHQGAAVHPAQHHGDAGRLQPGRHRVERLRGRPGARRGRPREERRHHPQRPPVGPPDPRGDRPAAAEDLELLPVQRRRRGPLRDRGPGDAGPALGP